MNAALVALLLATSALAQTDESRSIFAGGPWGEVSVSVMSSSGGAPPMPTFDLNPSLAGSGPSLLSSALTVNGTAMTLLADYDGRDPSGASWVARGGVAGTLAEAGPGVSPTYARPLPFVEAAARGVQYGNAATKYHRGSSTGIGTSDYAYELVVRIDASANTSDFMGDIDGTNGFDVQYLAGGNLRFEHADGTGFVTGTTGAPAQGTWWHLMCFGKRSANLHCDIDGGQTTVNVAISTKAATITNADGLSIGGANYINATGTSASTVGLVRVWKCSACLNTEAEQDTIALSRFSQLTGVWPSIAVTSAPTSTPRATLANMDIDRDGDGVRRVFTVGNGWMRTSRFRDSAATYRSGILQEGPSTNLTLQSQTINNASWTKTAAGADLVIADQTAAPDGTTTADVLEAATDVVGIEHGVSQASTLTAATYVFSAYLKASAQTFAYLRDDTIANGAAWINLTTCANGAKQAGVSRQVSESMGSGWCRLSITFTGTAAAHTLSIRAASADNTLTFTEGLNNDPEIYAWGAQSEQSTYASSYIATTTATVTRNKDDLLYSPTGNTSSTTGTLVVSYVCPPGASANYRLLSLSDGNNNSVVFNPSDETHPLVTYTTAAASQFALTGATAAFTDLAQHTDRAMFTTNNSQAWHDGVSLGTDTSVTTFSDVTATRLAILSNGAAATGGQQGCWATRVRAYPSLVPGSAGAP